MGVAVFDYAKWIARFPALVSDVPEPTAEEYFTEATVYLDNTDSSLVADVAQRLLLLNLLVAHIAILNGAGPGGAAAAGGMVGRISNASEGSVSITADFKAQPGSEQWYAQTPPGAQYWAMTAQYRTMQYVPGPQPYLGVPGSGGLGGRSWSR